MIHRSIAQSHGKRSADLVELLDLYPSIADLAAPKGDYRKELYAWSHGLSWRPLLEQTPGWSRHFALTVITACYLQGEHKGRFGVGCCKGRSFTWGAGVDLTYGPKAPLLGFGVRTRRMRYICWMIYDAKNDDVDWSQPPYTEELYDYGSLNASVPDYDAWTALPNLLHPSPRNGTLRTLADHHLKMLKRDMVLLHGR